MGLAKAALSALQAPRARADSRAPGLRILGYHRVAAERDQLALSQRRFRRHVELVAASGVDVVDLGSFDFDRPADRPQIAFTFDDGYRDFAENALPLLERFGYPAVVFVVPEAVERRVAFPWYRGRQPPLLDWSEMRSIERGGLVRFEPHTMTHACLPDLDDERSRWEIGASKRAVERALGRPARLFCYPGGFYGRREVELTRTEGLAAAVTCEYGLNRFPFDRHALRRTLVDRYDAAVLFRARLAGRLDRPPPGRRSRALDGG